MGESISHSRKGYRDAQFDDDESTEDTSAQDTEVDTENEAQIALLEREDALVESALRRIRKAQEKRKPEVKLNKDELAALERRRKRMQAEAAQASVPSSSERKKKADDRIAVPLSQLEPLSRKENKKGLKSAGTWPSETQPSPPVGFFPPPSTSRSRPRSGTTSSRKHDSVSKSREHSSSPFQPGQAGSSNRQSSDPSLNSRSKRASLPPGRSLVPSLHASASAPSVQATVDPFQYMSTVSRAPSHVSGAVSGRRTISGPPVNYQYQDSSRRQDPAAVRGRRGSRHFSPYDSASSAGDQIADETSDDTDEGARVASPTIVSRSRADIVVEVDREPSSSPDLQKSKKSSGSSPAKRKSGSSRKKKGR